MKQNIYKIIHINIKETNYKKKIETKEELTIRAISFEYQRYFFKINLRDDTDF